MYNFNKIKKIKFIESYFKKPESSEKRMIKFLEIAVMIIIIGILFSSVFVNLVYANPAPRGFETDNVLLKLMVKQGEPISKAIKITSTGSVREDFRIIENLDFLSVGEEEFSLEPEETKILEINFNSIEQPGVYVGSIIILSGKEELKIPIILEIETKEVLFDSSISIPLDYREIYPGGSIAVENKIFNLENIGLKTVDVNYAVKDFDGRTIFSEEENIAVENQVLTTKLISIPESAKTGDYVLFVEIEYFGSVGTSSHFFKIVEEQQGLGSSRPPDLWIFIIVLAGVIVFFIVFTSQRDKLFLELEKQHGKEMKEEIERINREKRKISRLKTEKRKKELKKLMEKKKKRLKVIRRIYRERVKTFKKLKKQKKKSEMEEKLAEWKKQGYNVDEFLIKTEGKKQNLKDIGGKIKSYKKQGYKF